MAERRSDDPKIGGGPVPGVATTVTPKQLQYAVHNGVALSGTLDAEQTPRRSDVVITPFLVPHQPIHGAERQDRSGERENLSNVGRPHVHDHQLAHDRE